MIVKNNKEIIYIDMDGVLVDFTSALKKIEKSVKDKFTDRLDEIPGLFSLMTPMPGAVNAFNQLAAIYDVYILSTAPWENASAWSDKLAWVKNYLGEKAYKRLILSHHKNLCHGKYLIDDRTKNGAEKFSGKLLLFGSDEFPNWKSILEHLL
jgi:5'(3')-deoxyribonucleotidase